MIERIGQEIAEAEAERSVASRKFISAATSARAWSNWSSLAWHRKFALRKHSQRERQL